MANKSIRLYLYLSVIIVFISACEQQEIKIDEEKLVKIDNSFNYDGNKYEVNDVVLRYTSVSDLANRDSINENTHHLYDLFLTDGSVAFDCHSGCYSNAYGQNATYFIAVRFAIAVEHYTSEFPMQTFSSILPEVSFSGNSPAKTDFYTTFFFRIDEGDNEFNSTDIFVDGSEGTISFKKLDEEYIVTIEAQDTESDNILPIEGSYTGQIKQVTFE